MKYEQLKPAQRQEIIDNSLLQAEADHFRATVNRDRALALKEDSRVKELDTAIATLEADITTLKSARV